MADHAKIRRSLGFVNKIAVGKQQERSAKYILVCIAGTYQYVLAKHTSMYWWNILVCILDTIWYVFGWQARELGNGGE
jgi:hypothetical protein